MTIFFTLTVIILTDYKNNIAVVLDMNINYFHVSPSESNIFFSRENFFLICNFNADFINHHLTDSKRLNSSYSYEKPAKGF